MKILFIEDNEASIANAQRQFAGHELKVAATAMEVVKLLESLKPIDKTSPVWKPDVIVTDMNIPMGDAGRFSIANHYSKTDQTPAGLVIAIHALIIGIPCYIITDSNSHRDLLGLMLDNTLTMFYSFDQVQRKNEMRMMLDCSTRPFMLENGGKDYQRAIDWIAKYHSGIPTQPERAGA